MNVNLHFLLVTQGDTINKEVKEMKTILIVIGPPGSGKGTQALKLKEHFNIGHISAGELLREEVKHHTALGHRIEDIISHGDMVPQSIIEKLLLNRVQESDCENGFILDGFPRTIDQTTLFERVLRSTGSKITAVIDYELDDMQAVKRIKGRAESDKTAGKEVREDDLDENIIKHRFVVYHQKTEPLISYFKQTGKLIKVNANQSVDEIFDETIKKIS